MDKAKEFLIMARDTNAKIGSMVRCLVKESIIPRRVVFMDITQKIKNQAGGKRYLM